LRYTKQAPDLDDVRLSLASLSGGGAGGPIAPVRQDAVLIAWHVARVNPGERNGGGVVFVAQYVLDFLAPHVAALQVTGGGALPARFRLRDAARRARHVPEVAPGQENTGLLLRHHARFVVAVDRQLRALSRNKTPLDNTPASAFRNQIAAS